MDTHNIGTTLKRLRLDKGLTQAQLAAPRYTHAFVSSIESGRRRPSGDAVNFLAQKLGVTKDELLTGRSPSLEIHLAMQLAEARLAVSQGDGQQVEQLQATAEEARRIGLTAIAGGALTTLGLLLERGGKPEDALDFFQRAAELLAEESSGAKADCVAGKARCHQAMGDLGYAIFLLEDMLADLRRQGSDDPDALLRLHSSLVDAYLDAGLTRQAAESARLLERIEPRVNDPLRLAQMHMNVARLHVSSGRIDLARDALRRAEDAYRQLRLRAELGGTYLAGGYIEARDGDLDRARRLLETAREIFEETNDDKDLSRALNELARVARLQGRLADAGELLTRSIELLEESETLILGWAFRELAMVRQGPDPMEAEKALRSAIDLFERGEQPIELAITYRELGDLITQQGRVDEANRLYRVGLGFLESAL